MLNACNINSTVKHYIWFYEAKHKLPIRLLGDLYLQNHFHWKPALISVSVTFLNKAVCWMENNIVCIHGMMLLKAVVISCVYLQALDGTRVCASELSLHITCERRLLARTCRGSII